MEIRFHNACSAEYWKSYLLTTYETFPFQIYWRYVSPFLARAPRNSRLLELGCGVGYFGFKIEDCQDCQIVGIDISTNQIAAADWFKRQRGYRSTFAVADIEQLPFQDGTFGAIFVLDVLHHFPELDVSVAEAARVLKNRGVFVVLEPNPVSPATLLRQARRHLVGLRPSPNETSCGLRLRTHLASSMQTAFRIVACQTIRFIPTLFLRHSNQQFDALLSSISVINQMGSHILCVGERK